MACKTQIQIEIYKNKISQGTICESINLDSSNLSDYVNVLRSVQKSVNMELTKIVEQDRIDHVPIDEEDIEGLEDDSDDEVTKCNSKRKLSSEKIKKKVKK
uniref:Uncharacterized protein n=1 Tax=Photinus pyralis TaxID=7054 RepID=A0A1Y1MU96_PHOPY